MPVIAGSPILASDILKTLNVNGQLELADSTVLTIATGVVTITQNFHRIETESGATTDDLDTITLGASMGDGFILILRPTNDAHTIVLKHNTGNILTATLGSVTLDDAQDYAILVYDGNLAKWMVTGLPAIGANGTVLASNGTVPSFSYATPVAFKTQRATTQDNSSAEVTLLSYSVPANTLGSAGAIHLHSILTCVADGGGSRIFTFRIKLGVTTLLTLTATIPVGSSVTLNLDIWLTAEGATNAQRATGGLDFTAAGADGTERAQTTHRNTGTSAIDTTAAATLAATIQMATAAVGEKWTERFTAVDVYGAVSI